MKNNLLLITNTLSPSLRFLQLPDDWRTDPLLAFPGLSTRKVDMAAFNTPLRRVQDRRALTYYAALHPSAMPAFDAAPNLHACAHLYASDRNGLFLCASILGVDEWRAMASLSHTVVFHTTGAALRMTDAEGNARWMLQEARTDRLEDDRVTHHSRIWDDAGKHVATTLQDGMLKLSRESGSKL